MIYLTNIFKDIVLDFDKVQYIDSTILSRRFVLKRGTIILISVYKYNMLCEISISIPRNMSVESLNSIPKWKGMEEKISRIIDNNVERCFLSFKQINNYDKKIFFLVMQDIMESISDCKDNNIVFCIKEVLIKWNTFFQFDKNYILSDTVQQGLYGELYILEKMIDIKGEDAVDSWTGCNAETHDFYCGKDAVEVKSSSAKGPDRVNISNEYQLDDSGLLGKLYLLYLKMKKSEVDGETLSDIVTRIATTIGQANRLNFYNKLLKVGYLYQMPELYTIRFRIREESCYMIRDGFPRITAKTISRGISSVDYVISLDACDSYQITIESFYKGVNW